MIHELLSALAVVTAIMLLFFGIAQYIKNNSIADVAWGMGIVALSATLFFTRGTFTPLQLLVMLLVSIWGFRLTSHIGMRQWCKPEDQRYVEWRKSWGSYQVLGALLFVFALQGSLMFVISAPVIAIMLGQLAPIGIFALVGTGIWIVGFMCESIADAQLAAFLKNPLNRGKLMMEGLWRYSRHPNYFGELLMWWGLYIIALSVPHGYLSIIGPAVLTYLLLYVSGVPLAEKTLMHHPDFARYKETTSILILLPARR